MSSPPLSSAVSSSAEPVLFKKRSVKKKTIVLPVPEVADRSPQEEEADLQKIRELREEQKFTRQQARGVLFDSSSIDEPSSSPRSADPAPAAAPASGPEEKHGLDFHADATESNLNSLMEKYIQDKLEEKKKQGKGDAAHPAGKEQKRKEENKDNKKPEDPLLKPKTTMDVDESGDRWLQGIQEIALPIETRLQNIEATERARQQKIREESRRPAFQSSVSSNMSVNFERQQFRDHKRFASEMEGAAPDQGPIQGMHPLAPPAVAALPQNQQATDDLVVQRFIKRFKFKR